MFKLVKKNKLLYLVSLFLIVLYSCMDIAKSILMSEIFDNQKLVASVTSGIWIVLIFLGFYLMIIVFQQFVVEVLKNKIRFNLNKGLYGTYLKMYPNEFKKYDSSMIINELNNEVNVITEQYISAKLNVFFLFISFILGSIYIGMLSLGILLFLYICGLSILLLNQLFSDQFKKNQKKLLESQQRWIKVIKNFCVNFKVIRNYSIENKFEELLDKSNRDLEIKTVKSNGFMKIVSAMNTAFSQIMFFGTLLFGVVLINSGMLTVGKLIGIVQASNMIIMPISNYINLKNSINASVPILMEFEEKLKYIPSDGTIVMEKPLENINVTNLSFAYEDKLVLKDVNLIFERGNKYLIVGKSGCGKSTLLELIAKQQTSMNISVNKYRLSDVTFSSYASHFSYLTQKDYLLPFDLKTNITLNNKNDSNFEDILSILNLEEFAKKSKYKFADDAPEISGGELQRINLARAIYNKKEWLFLDEAFSSLDEKTMISIEKNLLKRDDLSIIAISHKLIPEIVKLYDQVILINDKKAVVYDSRTFISEKLIT